MSTHRLNVYLASVLAVMWLASAASSQDVALGYTAARQTVQQSESSIVETTALSEPELAGQPQGHSEPNMGESEPRDGGKRASSSGRLGPPQGWTTYIDRTYGFSIRYPKGFVVQPQDVSKLTQFTPTPLASIFFMNPTMAKGALAGIEPPDMELRVYQAGTVNSLKSWLTSVGFLNSGSAAQPYRNANVSGVKLCQSTLIAPGCFIYVLHDSRVYQLTPISREGEAMLETFALSTRR